jgi:hypothetical protein
MCNLASAEAQSTQRRTISTLSTSLFNKLKTMRMLKDYHSPSLGTAPIVIVRLLKYARTNQGPSFWAQSHEARISSGRLGNRIPSQDLHCQDATIKQIGRDNTPCLQARVSCYDLQVRCMSKLLALVPQHTHHLPDCTIRFVYEEAIQFLSLSYYEVFEA